MTSRELWLGIICLAVGATIALTAGRFYSPTAQTYALPEESWRVTTYQSKRGQVFVRIEAVKK